MDKDLEEKYEESFDDLVSLLANRINKLESELQQAKGKTENMKDLFWSMLQNLEGKTNPEKDILDKTEVESAYKIWNKTYQTNIKPRWIKEWN